MVICLEEFDPGVKEAAAWALGYIARHNGGKYVRGRERRGLVWCRVGWGGVMWCDAVWCGVVWCGVV